MEQNASRSKTEALAALSHAERQLEMIYFNSSIPWRDYKSSLDGIDSIKAYFRGNASSAEGAREALASIRNATKNCPNIGSYEVFRKDLGEVEALL